MALGLTLVSGVFALTLSAAAWLLGFATLGQAAIAYVCVGWAVMALGLLAGLAGQFRADAQTRGRPGKVIPRTVVVDVTAATRN
ncbi:MAG: hypothetical protein ACOCYW_08925 [Roseicyclus sp.]